MFNMTKNSVKLYLIAVLCISFHQVVSEGFCSWLKRCCPETTSEVKQMEYIALEEERTRRIEKEGREAEIAFITRSFMGFVNPDVQPKPSLLEDYFALRNGNAVERHIVPVENFNQNNVVFGILLCKSMLREPVLAANNIYFNPAPTDGINYEEKLLRFEYYTREPETVLALKCPVTFNGIPNFLYFGGSGWHENGPLASCSHYFVMFASSSEADSLTMLMRTRTKFLPRRNNESPIRQEKERSEYPNVPHDFDQLTIPEDLKDEPFRLFKMDAERSYITANYGFINLDRTKQENIDQLIKYLDLFKSGHEAERSSVEVSLFDGEDPETRFDICWRFIENNEYLPGKFILDSEEIVQDLGTVIKTITYPGFELLPVRQTRKLIKCPAKRRYIQTAKSALSTLSILIRSTTARKRNTQNGQICSSYLIHQRLVILFMSKR